MQFDNMSAHYLKTPVIKFDQAYGIKPIHDNDSHTFKIGGDEVTIDGKDFIIGEKRLKGREGLWKLFHVIKIQIIFHQMI